MLQKASISRKPEMEMSLEAGFLPSSARIGDEIKRAARSLHDALERMEKALSASRRPAGENHAEAILRDENNHLKESEARLNRQLEDMRIQNELVSEQVTMLSGRLEALITHLARLLEEEAA